MNLLKLFINLTKKGLIMKKLLTLSLLVLATVSLNLNGQQISFDGEQMIIKKNEDKKGSRLYTNQEEKNLIEGLEADHEFYEGMTPKEIAIARTQAAIDSRNAEERHNALNVQPPHSATFTCSDCHENFLLTDAYNHKKLYCIKLSCKISDSCQYLMFQNKEQLKLHLKYEHKLNDWTIENIYKIK